MPDDAAVSLGRLLPSAPSSAELLERLRPVIDPELGIGIVDLGLVRDVRAAEGVAHVLMTTTTPACPIGSYLGDAIRWTLLAGDDLVDVDVELTHDPPWSPDHMSDEAKVQLGWAR